MWHRLALAWSCPVSEAKRRCTLREFYQWIAYEQISPFGEDRADLRAAIIANATVQAMGHKRSRIKDYLASMFFKPKTQSPQDMQAFLRHFAAQHNARLRAEAK